MTDVFLIIISAVAAVTLVVVIVIALRLQRIGAHESLTKDLIAQLLRGETDLIRRAGDEQARGVRQELAEHVKGAQDSTIKTFGVLADQVTSQINSFRERVDAAIKAIAEKLDLDMRQMGEAAASNRESLRRLIEDKLDATATKQSEEAKGLREELNAAFHRLGGNITSTLTDFGQQQKDRLEATKQALEGLADRHEKTQEALRQSVEGRLDSTRQESASKLDEMRKTVDEKLHSTAERLDLDIRQMGEAAASNRETLRRLVEDKLDATATKQSEEAKGLREELNAAFHRLGGSVEGRLDAIRQESASKLDEMRKTVDEKLQSTLESRLGESFNLVVEQLKSVHDGLGEMRALASNVGDLKNVLTNVKVRGTFGEVQLELLLEQFLAPDQYVRDARIKDETTERVEFAVRLPGKGDGEGVIVPIDAKFPREAYDRLVSASDANDTIQIDAMRKQLQAQVRQCAKDIRDKYILPPKTTDFAILFLPTEGLFAEVLRQPGLFDQIQREFKVTVAGPTTLCAYLNALQMGFRSLAIEKRSSEVWTLLSAVQSEFSKYNEVVKKLGRTLQTATDSVEKLGTRTRVMNRTLKSVERLPDTVDARALLGLAPEDVGADDDELTVESGQSTGQLVSLPSRLA